MTPKFGPYTPLRQAGNFLYVSGQVGVHPETKVAPKSVSDQTERALLNLEMVLRKSGSTLDDIVKTTVFLSDMGDYNAMNKIYEQRFDTPRPARSTVGVKELPRVAGDVSILVEIEAVAYRASI